MYTPLHDMTDKKVDAFHKRVTALSENVRKVIAQAPKTDDGQVQRLLEEAHIGVRKVWMLMIDEKSRRQDEARMGRAESLGDIMQRIMESRGAPEAVAEKLEVDETV